MDNKVTLTLPWDVHHLCQIVTGFLRLQKEGLELTVINDSAKRDNPFYGLPVCFAQYRGKTLAYDLWDGYQEPERMQQVLNHCDLYFKRSFSQEKNEALFPGELHKIHPLGFNYHVTVRENPINEPFWKEKLKPLQGRAPDVYFTPEVFEGSAERISGKPKILFLTRLWDRAPGLLDDELDFINQTRIEIIRTLRATYGDCFVGGLNDLPISRELAPDLIVPAKLTERKKYVRLLHGSDICIGSMGLHESIGWKTGEYVAAAKAIVNETFHYQVPGDFRAGKHYLPFATAEECIAAVQSLVEDPQKLYDMKLANEHYYRDWLKPEVLVRHTLDLADKIFEKK